jgi:glycosyltransferase involved in cell wall biosynthesis
VSEDSGERGIPSEMGSEMGSKMDVESGRLTVLIPVYNEQDLVEEVIDRVFCLGELIHEVIAINDGSTDETRTVLDRLAQQPAYCSRLRVLHMPRNQGKTSAIQQGLLEATGECVIIQDADLEYDPAEIPDVVGPILSGEADVVYGSRFLVRRAARVLYFYHYLANKFLTLLSNLLTNRNMTDIETGYKAFRREVIQPLRLTSKGFGMEVEITAMICKTRARTYEVPISYHGRTYEEGKKIGFRDGVAAIWYIFYYNLIQPHRREGREYVRSVNEFLRENAPKKGTAR